MTYRVGYELQGSGYGAGAVGYELAGRDTHLQEHMASMPFTATMTLDEALAADGEKLRQLTGEDHGPWCYEPSPAGYTFEPIGIEADAALYTRDLHLEATSRLLDDDAVAATMVAATINIRQAAGESGGAFVKRIVRSWLTEMARTANV